MCAQSLPFARATTKRLNSRRTTRQSGSPSSSLNLVRLHVSHAELNTAPCCFTGVCTLSGCVRVLAPVWSTHTSVLHHTHTHKCSPSHTHTHTHSLSLSLWSQLMTTLRRCSPWRKAQASSTFSSTSRTIHNRLQIVQSQPAHANQFASAPVAIWCLVLGVLFGCCCTRHPFARTTALTHPASVPLDPQFALQETQSELTLKVWYRVVQGFVELERGEFLLHARTRTHTHTHAHTNTHTNTSTRTRTQAHTHARCSSRCCCWFSTASPPLPLARPPTRCAETRHHTRRVYLEHLMRLLRVLQRKMMYPANVEDLNQDYAQSIESQSCFRAARACGCACICGCACACICVCLPACLSVCLCPACLPLCLILHACISLPFSSHPLFVLFLWQTEYRQEAGNVIMFISCFTTTVCMQVRYTN